MVTTHFPPYHLGGDAVFVKYLSEELARRGHEVHVFHHPSAFKAIRGEHVPRSIEQVDSRLSRHTTESSAPGLDTLISLTIGTRARAVDQFASLAKSIEPDVIHWHNTKGFIGTPLPLAGAESLYTAHDYFAVCTRSNLMKPNGTVCTKPRLCMLCNLRRLKPAPIWRIGGKRVLHLPRDVKVLAPSEFMAKRLAQDGIRTPRVLRNFVPDPKSMVSGAQSGRNLILYVGMLEPHKGPQTLLEAFSASRTEHEFELCMIGQGSLSEVLAKTIRRKKLGDRVRLLGSISRNELLSMRQQATAQVVPSEWFENSPLTAIEAMAAGIPLIGSDIGGLTEILTRENGATMFPPGDSGRLATMLAHLWRTRETANDRGIASRRAYERAFTPDTHIVEYMDNINAD
jgi:glycosyltransferase involved in cell wall biosynthesis